MTLTVLLRRSLIDQSDVEKILASTGTVMAEARLPDDEARIDRVCELNVIAQVKSLYDSPIVKRAWHRHKVPAVHGWIYRLNDGRLADLQCSPSEL